MVKKILWSYIVPFILAVLLYPYIWTIRAIVLNRYFQPRRRNKGGQFIYGHWHEDIPLLSLRHAFSNCCTMASRSRDGELITRVLKLLGYEMVRGSSKYFGSETLSQIINSFNEGKNFVLAMDGPKGPRNEVKLGVSYIAARVRKKVIPVAANAKYKYVFHKSWDHMWFPLPFSPAVIIFGDPIEFSGQESKEELQQKRLEIQTKLLELKEKAISYYS